MGQQVNFYLTPTDLQAAEERVHKCGAVLVLHDQAPEPRPRVVPSLDFQENGASWLFFYLARAGDLDALIMRQVAKQNYWGIDEQRSPVVEVTTCFFDGRKIRRGRVYFQTSYYAESGQLVTKSEAFLKWGRCVLSAVKRTLVRDPQFGAYIGPDTRKWIEQGGIVLKPHE